MTMSRWIILAVATLLLLLFGYLDAQELGVSGQSFVIVMVGYPISMAFFSALAFGWKAHWRRHIPTSMMVLAGILFAGHYAAPDDPASAESSGGRGMVPATATAGLGVRQGNSLRENDSLTNTRGHAATFELSDGTIYVSSEHLTLGGEYRVASLYNGSGPSFMV